MSPLWNRLRRLWHEPRIRLPALGLRPAALRPGDRLQIGSRLWRIASRRGAAPAAAFELTAAEGPPIRARLRCNAGRWSLADGSEGSPGIVIDAETVIHFSLARSPSEPITEHARKQRRT